MGNRNSYMVAINQGIFVEKYQNFFLKINLSVLRERLDELIYLEENASIISEKFPD